MIRTKRRRVGLERVNAALARRILFHLQAGKWPTGRAPALRQPDMGIFALHRDLEPISLPPGDVVLLARRWAEDF
jgi:hypothetical protein